MTTETPKHLKPIIKSLLQNDMYKFSMGQLFLHQFSDAVVEWTYKNRDPNTKFTQEMIDEINWQIDQYCTLRFTEAELGYLRRIRYLKSDYIDYLYFWHPRREQITCELNKEIMQPEIHFRGPNTQVSYYEVPVMAIVAGVYFQMHYTVEEQLKAMTEAQHRLEEKIQMLADGKYNIGSFSEFGLRRAFSLDFQDEVVRQLSQWKFYKSKFVGTSNVYLAYKYGVTPVGTMAHEAIELVGQGYPEKNPAYSNKYMMDAWHKEYGLDNGIYLTDCITTKCFLKDFNKMEATMFTGLRHDSGDPVIWGEDMLAHYTRLGIDRRNKTLLFSDSLNFEKANMLWERFSARCNVAFGIGTWLVSDCGLPIMNHVIKLTEVNGIPVCKLSDADKDIETGLPSKFMGKDIDYAQYLMRAIDFRVKNDTIKVAAE